MPKNIEINEGFILVAQQLNKTCQYNSIFVVTCSYLLLIEVFTSECVFISSFDY